jgi:hypothetical protein
MTLVTRNLGQVKGYFSQATAPSNTTVIWNDTSVSPNVKKTYNSISGTWVPMAGQILMIEGLYTEIEDLKNNSLLEKGVRYKITDRADNGIVLSAISSNKFSLGGEGVFLNPDFQSVGNYSGVLAEVSVAYGNTLGVWQSTEPGYADGDVVFWDGLHYIVSDAGALAGTDPVSAPLAYTTLPKSAANVGYIEEVDSILYDFTNDQIIWQEDIRGNKWNPSSVSSFQRGNDNVSANIVESNADIDIINQRGTIRGSTITSKGNSYFLAENDFIGTFNNNEVSSEVQAKDSITINTCIINAPFDIFFENGVSYSSKEVSSLGSTFEADLDMTPGQNYDAGTDTLTIPTNLNYVGIFNLKASAGQTIVNIENLPTPFEVEFSTSNASTVVFTNTAISSAVANNLVADVTGNNTLTGRTNGNDFVRYKKSGTLNVEVNGSILIQPKIYIALLTQSGTGAPTAIIKKNTLGGTPLWSRLGAGQYSLILAGVFGITKSAVKIFAVSDSGVPGCASYEGGKYGVSDDDNITIYTHNDDNGTSKHDFKDDLLYNSLIEITVYPS